ncbi:hypothetical protein LY01_02933 [Nonlabens xylanidelens]|uniref:Uncharacterized protein n=1 Tax=Nonlabens xylanidelens TaxID=191564 RepID=A0A2S6IE89_9FLAO|nr:hypothetical protein LY01_02933 [Nonlabens xylanidelens]PQJ22063.1 hypothetical protein BST94_00345 [Nonlabens xylanidelens]
MNRYLISNKVIFILKDYGIFSFVKVILSYPNFIEHIDQNFEHIYYLAILGLKFCNIEYEAYFKST